MAVLELVCGRMLGKVYSCLLDIVIQCGIEDRLKVSGGRGHQSGHQSGETNRFAVKNPQSKGRMSIGNTRLRFDGPSVGAGDDAVVLCTAHFHQSSVQPVLPAIIGEQIGLSRSQPRVSGLSCLLIPRISRTTSDSEMTTRKISPPTTPFILISASFYSGTSLLTPQSFYIN
jgi:hypothetical protein